MPPNKKPAAGPARLISRCFNGVRVISESQEVRPPIEYSLIDGERPNLRPTRACPNSCSRTETSTTSIHSRRRGIFRPRLAPRKNDSTKKEPSTLIGMPSSFTSYPQITQITQISQIYYQYNQMG